MKLLLGIGVALTLAGGLAYIVYNEPTPEVVEVVADTLNEAEVDSAIFVLDTLQDSVSVDSFIKEMVD